ncbi:SDR family NAD(P)-dependent oxidoreductase [Paenibacillus sp. L3-i20]|uniref:SDR family NAD(P)-dependent oxidoreductase n=1 Tax=Paenibacillus sp. L3-i20 TaxID=2905833 RepID=UPI001EDDE45C|nr:SDR family NAD(P)-dependent oxidoreductase [Paenibacillus sp. L3-i20]GKU77429.1 hypothetical protein L3i20_v218260 [Paenibacillus sp. L3-i20]
MGHTVLITGGASGIGLALTEDFLQRGNHVIIIGQNEEKLKQLKTKHPSLSTYSTEIV